MTTSTITWHRPSDGLPDDETNVLLGLRLPDGRRTSCEGFRDGDCWRDVCAVEIEDAEVIAWAELPRCEL